VATVATEVAEGILTVTLDRPDRLNAFTPEMQYDLIAALDQADEDRSVRCVVVTGRGRAFCAGADLSAGGDSFDAAARASAAAGPQGDADGGPGGRAGNGSAGDGGGERAQPGGGSRGREERAGNGGGGGGRPGRPRRDGGGMVSLRIFQCTKPVIAAINGPAVGVGVTMTLPMDIRLAAESARFGFVFARRGLVPEAASSWFLPRVVGISRAAEWCFTGRVFGADEALAAGLVRSVHPDGELLDAAYALAGEIAASTSPVSVTLTRQMLWHMLGEPHPMAAHRVDSAAIDTLGRGADVREGVTSFLEKRPPSFPSRVPDDLPPFTPWWEEPEY
jgi:enoyl-CoA hydratase/carnithine racemase